MSGKNKERGRRDFLKSAGAMGLILAASVPVAGAAFAQTAMAAPGDTHAPIQGTQVFHVKVRTDLYSPPLDLDVVPGKLTDPVALKGKGLVRLRITPDKVDPHFGPSYHVVVTDAKGNKLAAMNIGSNTTATFENLGIQIYLLSVQQAT